MAQYQLLYGTLEATIFEIDPFPDRFFDKERGCMTSGTKLYTTISLGNVIVGGTRLIECSSNPQRNEPCHIYCAHRASHVTFSIKQDKPFREKLIGRASIPVEEIINKELQMVKIVDEWLDIVDKDDKPRGSKLHVKLQFLHATGDPNWSKGIMSPKYSGVPKTFFPQKNGCRVSLYQDAHIPNDFLKDIPIHLGVPKKDEPHKYEEAWVGDENLPKFNYEPHRCWEDVFDAISDAKRLIYIAGWSVYTEITLVRDQTRQKPGGHITLGELLKKKADDEGVKVLMLVWNDKTSIEKVNYDGTMGTHGKETRKYFQNTDVHCVLCPRHPNDGSSLYQNMKFSHHQKILVVDSEIPNGELDHRRIVSFIGGIDLCGGRYDTPVHSIFRTLDAEHSLDFHQPNFEGAAITKGGPREPWHDIHCKLEGPIAWDVLENFEQRWKKQGHGDAKLIIDLATINIKRSYPVMPHKDYETWNVQLFRSIDRGASCDFPDDPDQDVAIGLVHEKDNTIDRSIQDAYINAIRRAKKYIYIESQFFLGSSFGWDTNELKVDALHLIPKELSLKIVSKIEANERFTVYIVIPMWPEGPPDSKVVQTILKMQTKTMEMMYSDIVCALRAKGLGVKPKEYLTFFCLGNREKKESGEYAPPMTPKHNTDYSRAQQARRFMIYLHSKMMIVDDEYIIIGSANINQRSMDGGRDTEIAMGGYQPYHLDTKQHPARGQIYGFRMALWYEHLGMLEDTFDKPESLKCVEKVNQLADKYWGLYASETLEKDLPGHLLSYPIKVTEYGKVVELPGTEFFPDTKARILGNISRYLPLLGEQC